MAELNQPATGSRKQKGVRRSKKNSTRVDLTPMVDLGFLLITFFIFSTTIRRPKAMDLPLPKDVPKDQLQNTAVSGVLTLLLGSDDRVFYYERDDPRMMKAVPFSVARSIILDKKKRTRPSDFTVILKAGTNSTFGNTVHILDEMVINNVGRYAFVDISKDETEIMKEIDH